MNILNKLFKLMVSERFMLSLIETAVAGLISYFAIIVWLGISNPVWVVVLTSLIMKIIEEVLPW